MVKDPCAYCGGTGAIRCNHCGGTGINENSSLLQDQCHGCKGTGRERCQSCRGTGEWWPVGVAASQEQLIQAGWKNIPRTE